MREIAGALEGERFCGCSDCSGKRLGAHTVEEVPARTCEQTGRTAP